MLASNFNFMNSSEQSYSKRAFTLIETVIAIGVLAVLLTGFMLVFGPAAEGIRTSVNAQIADRLASTFEQELVQLRPGQQSAADEIKSAFDKAFVYVKNSGTKGNQANALVVYQYRADLRGVPRADGSLPPRVNITGQVAGQDYLVKTMMRRASDPAFRSDIPAVEGAVFFGVCRQLVFRNSQLTPVPKPGEIRNPNFDGRAETGQISGPDSYPESVLAFVTDFHITPSRDPNYFSGLAFGKLFDSAAELAKRPVFSRNMAVRR